MTSQWQIKDLIDLEYFLQADETGDDETARKSLVQRDRSIFLSMIQPRLEAGKDSSRRFVLREWLSERRKAEKKALGQDTVLPGEAFEEIHRLLKYGLTLLGILIGAGLASSFLAYTGNEPLNVSFYLGGLVLVQLILLLILLVFTAVRAFNRTFLEKSILYSFLSGLIIRLMLKLKHRALKKLSGNRRSSLQEIMGLARGKKKIYGSLFYWPVFILGQIFGIGFNIGVLAATLLRVVGSDIAFGWQSTVQFSPDVVHELVRSIALPWSWFIPAEIAYPSLAQIEGSRMILKEGIYHLATQDLISWWPFLCFAVFFYGLLPRVILWLAGITAQHHVLKKIDFSHRAADRLMYRLETPQVSTEGSPSAALPETATAAPAERPFCRVEPGESSAEKQFIALVPDDIFEECPTEELDTVVCSALGWQVREKLRIGEDQAADQAILAELAGRNRGEQRPAVLVVQEAWQPPIREVLAFLQELRNAVGEKSRIEVGLIGKPAPDTIFTPVSTDNWTVWQQKLNTFGDPYLGLERLVKARD